MKEFKNINKSSFSNCSQEVQEFLISQQGEDTLEYLNGAGNWEKRDAGGINKLHDSCVYRVISQPPKEITEFPNKDLTKFGRLTKSIQDFLTGKETIEFYDPYTGIWHKRSCPNKELDLMAIYRVTPQTPEETTEELINKEGVVFDLCSEEVKELLREAADEGKLYVYGFKGWGPSIKCKGDMYPQSTYAAPKKDKLKEFSKELDAMQARMDQIRKEVYGISK